MYPGQSLLGQFAGVHQFGRLLGEAPEVDGVVCAGGEDLAGVDEEDELEHNAGVLVPELNVDPGLPVDPDRALLVPDGQQLDSTNSKLLVRQYRRASKKYLCTVSFF